MTSTRGSIYLDNHATTPLDERVFLAMKPYFFADFGNPASQTHPYGWKAQDAVDQARLKLAAAINAHPSEIIFTASATEATNLALKGLFFPPVTTTKRSIIISSIEHSATLTTAHALEALGLRLVIIKPSKEGVITPELLSAHITDDTALVSFFLVHNEIGTINDIKALCAVAKRHNALIHCDGAQALGRITIDCQELGIDFLSLSAHKVYGPKGVGALYVRREIMPLLCPVIHGGGQEWQKRSGTINVPGVVGFGEAAAIANSDLHKDSSNIQYLRDKMWAEFEELGDVYLNGSIKDRVAGNLNISFSGIDGEELLLSICQRVALSTGSACASGGFGHSRVLSELGVNSELRQATLRIGIGRFNTLSDIEEAFMLIAREVKRQRGQGEKL